MDNKWIINGTNNRTLKVQEDVNLITILAWRNTVEHKYRKRWYIRHYLRTNPFCLFNTLNKSLNWNVGGRCIWTGLK